MLKCAIDDLITCVAFILHTHVANTTDMEKLLSRIHICDLTHITQQFIRFNIRVIQKTFRTYGNSVLYSNQSFQIKLKKSKAVVEIYDEFIKQINQLECDENEYLKSQTKFFEKQYLLGMYNFQPKVQFCHNKSYTWSIDNTKVCIPNKCSSYVYEQWENIAPQVWKNTVVYAYKFREISVPLHELLHINQTSTNLYVNEWEASYFSFSNLHLRHGTMDFAMKNLPRFLLFHESLVRNLYQTISKNKIGTVFKWHKQGGGVHGMSKHQILILDESIIKARDAKLNTFAKNFAALQWYYDTNNIRIGLNNSTRHV